MKNVKQHHSYLSTDEVTQLCEPLFNNLHVSFFKYGKSYQDKERMLLCSHRGWVEDYFSLNHASIEFLNFAHLYPKKGMFYNIWTGCHKDHRSCLIWSNGKEKYGLTHILSIYDMHDNYTEVFNFGGQGYGGHLESIFLSDLDLFRRFILHFKDKGADLIKKAKQASFYPEKDSNEIDSNKWVLGIQPESRQHFFDATKTNRYALPGKYESNYLNARQIACLNAIMKGKTYEEIASDLNISIRTVHYHMNGMRDIFHVKTKNQLLTVLDELGVLSSLRLL